MAIRQIRTIGDEILTKPCKPVKEMNERTIELIEDMFETMYEANGVGLAAPQVTYLMHDLASRGLAVDTSATTVKEAAKSIAEALRRS
mgnify:CR=1 FL=1